MATIACGNTLCKFRKAVYCGRDFTILNQYGMCKIWFDKNGNMRQVPMYPLESEPQSASEQGLPPEEISEEKSVFEDEKDGEKCEESVDEDIS